MATKNKPGFEEAVKRIEEIIKQMDSVKDNLEESMALFEEGTALIRYCNQKLDETKLKIEEITGEENTDE